jgi:uncharacterized protein YndB with AHSA1/START domain
MPDIKHMLQISATPEQVYSLAATAAGFKQWWAEDVEEPGGTVDLGFFKRDTTYRLRRVTERPPTHVEWICETGNEWGGTRIAFQIEPAKSGVLLRFTHAGWRAETDFFTSCNTTWGELMFRLKGSAEGKSRGPLFLAAGLAY